MLSKCNKMKKEKRRKKEEKKEIYSGRQFVIIFL
jgi:hypothetical protein